MKHRHYGGVGSKASKRCFATEKVNKRMKHDDIWYGDVSNIDNYIKSKLKMLCKDMYIKPTQQEIDNLYSLNNTVAIDNAVHSIIDRHWSKS